jgi:hypothetical protein
MEMGRRRWYKIYLYPSTFQNAKCIFQVGDPDMMAMMGFSGFGTSSKKT